MNNKKLREIIAANYRPLPKNNIAYMSQQHILQVSELTRKVRFILESELNTVWLTGEISNFIAAGSGHWYLSLKDSKSQVKCAMFKGSNRRVRLTPANGQQVLVRAKVSLYEPRGDFQLIIEQMEDAGEGLLRQKYEQLKNKLHAQGVFSIEHKKSLPSHIQTVGVVTSPTGAAVKDILSVLKRRNPNINVIIYPALVQGELAENDICYAIKAANLRNECQVLIVGRGGGSLEDLWSFNEESVVNAIFQSQIPVISAVGHEVDTTLSDYVADVRAATPSAAAELVSTDASELTERVLLLQQRLAKALAERLRFNQQQLKHSQHRLSQVHPEQQLQLQQQRVDELNLRLQQAFKNKMQRIGDAPSYLHQRLLQASPQKRIHFNQEQVTQLSTQLKKAMQAKLQNKGEAFAHFVEQLHIVSPLATIARGYSITRNEQGALIKSITQVKENDSIAIEVTDGSIQAKVLSSTSNR